MLFHYLKGCTGQWVDWAQSTLKLSFVAWIFLKWHNFLYLLQRFKSPVCSYENLLVTDQGPESCIYSKILNLYLFFQWVFSSTSSDVHICVRQSICLLSPQCITFSDVLFQMLRVWDIGRGRGVSGDGWRCGDQIQWPGPGVQSPHGRDRAQSAPDIQPEQSWRMNIDTVMMVNINRKSC